MEDQTIFIIVGLTLVAMALIVSFVGLRLESFPPSRGVLLGGLGLFVVVVGTAMTFAWMSAADEQNTRDEEIAAGELPSPAETQDEMIAAARESTAQSSGEAVAGEPGGAPEEPGGGGTTASADGAALFDSQGCAGCHALQAAGATGDVGPDLDAALKGQDVAFIEDSIVDPDAEIEKGFSGGIMPDDFEQNLSPEELDALVQFVAESVGAKQ